MYHLLSSKGKIYSFFFLLKQGEIYSGHSLQSSLGARECFDLTMCTNNTGPGKDKYNIQSFYI